MVYHLTQMVLNPRSTKKIDVVAETDPPEKSLVSDLLAGAFEKGNPEVCIRCQGDVRKAGHITDAYSQNSVCLECLAIESHMEYSDVDDQAWIPFSDAIMYDKKGRDITKLVREMVQKDLLPIHLKVHKMLEGKSPLPSLPSPSKVSKDRMVELRSILAAIDMAIDLGYKDDFLELTAKYNKLLEGGNNNGF